MFGDRIAIYETLTGRVVKWPAVSDVSFTQTINDAEGSLTITTNRDEVAASESVPWKYSLAFINVSNRVLAAGPIYKRDLSFDTGEVTITAGSFWSFLKKRVWQGTLEVARSGALPLVFANEEISVYKQKYRSTLYGIAFGVVRSQLRGELPGVTDDNFPYPEGTNEREWDGRDCKTVAECVAEVFNVQNPPVIRWEARFYPESQSVEWKPEALTADNVSGTTTPATHWLLLDSDKDVIIGATMNEDAGSLVNDSFIVSKQQQTENTSNGSANLNIVGYARWADVPNGWPRLQEADKSHDGVSNGSTRLAYAQGNATAQQSWSISLTISRGQSSAYGLHQSGHNIRAGDWVAIFSNEPFYGASTWMGRAEKVSGNLNDVTVSVERLHRRSGQGVDTAGMQTSIHKRTSGDASTRLLETIKEVNLLNNPTT